MYQYLFPRFLLFVIFLTQIWCDDVISGTNDQCADFCSKTYPAHTFDENGAEKSCKQGCRLFSVISAVDKFPGQVSSGDRLLGDENNKEKLNLTAVSTSCEHECRDAYSDEIFKGACIDGCRHQVPFTSGRVTMVVDEGSPLFPFASKLMNQAMSKFRETEDRMRSHFDSLRNWFKNDNMGTPLQIGSSSAEESDENDSGSISRSFQPFIDRVKNLFGNMNNVNPFSGEQQNNKKPGLLGGQEDIVDHLSNYGKDQNGSDKPIVVTERPVHLDGSEFKGNSNVGNRDENGEPIIIVKMIPVEGGEGGNRDGREWENVIAENEPSPPTRDEVMYGDADDGWLACLARRTQNLSTVSRWLLCAALMLSILCMLWLCLALVRTQHHRRRHLSIENGATKSDVVYFMPPPAYEKMPTSAAYMPLNEEKKEAPPSPPPAYEEHLMEKSVDEKTGSA